MSNGIITILVLWKSQFEFFSWYTSLLYEENILERKCFRNIGQAAVCVRPVCVYCPSYYLLQNTDYPSFCSHSWHSQENSNNTYIYVWRFYILEIRHLWFVRTLKPNSNVFQLILGKKHHKNYTKQQQKYRHFDETIFLSWK